jgi:hypothetical protein
MKKLLVVFVVSSFLASAAVAQSIYIDHHGSDTVGTSFAFELRQAIMSAKGYALLSSDDDKVPHFTADLVTLDRYLDGVQIQSPKGTASYVSYAVTLEFPRNDCTNGTRGQLLVLHGVLLVGSDRSKESAQNLLAKIDQAAAAIRKGFRKMSWLKWLSFHRFHQAFASVSR